jgi:hypothetical protein
MAGSESFEALEVQNNEQKRQGNEQNNGNFVEEEELEGDYIEEEEESQLSELQQLVELPSSQVEEEMRDGQVETLTVVPSSSTAILSKENDQHVGRFFLYYFFFVCVCFFFFFEFL